MKSAYACFLLLALAIPGLVPQFSLGHASPPGQRVPPEDIATRALAALQEKRIADFAKEVHPESLASMKAAMLAFVDSAEEKGKVAVALSVFKGVTDAGQLREMSDIKSAIAYLEGMFERHPHLLAPFKGMAIEVLGHVREGNDVVHVVYRRSATIGKVRMSMMTVLSLKADGDSWRVLLSADLGELAAMMTIPASVCD